MRKSILIVFLLMAATLAGRAPNFSPVDIEYIHKHIPAYEKANQQMEHASKQSESELYKRAKQPK